MRLRSAAAVALAVGGVFAGLLASGAAFGSASTASGAGSVSVSILPARQVVHAAQTLMVTVVNRGAGSVTYSPCIELARQVKGGWAPVTRSHGVTLSCSAVAFSLPGHARVKQTEGLPDDLRPGRYRLSLHYRKGSSRQRVATAPGVAIALVWIRGAEADLRKPRLPERRVLRLAERAAAAADDSHPALIQHSEGTRYEANRIASGEIVFERAWSYLIAVRGRFTLTRASRPQGARAPHGTILTLVVNAGSGRVTDSGVSDRYPGLAALGPVTTDAEG